MPTNCHDLSRLESSIRQLLYGRGSQAVVGVRRVRPCLFTYPGQHLGQLIYSQGNAGIPAGVGHSYFPSGLQTEIFCIWWNIFVEMLPGRGDFPRSSNIAPLRFSPVSLFMIFCFFIECHCEIRSPFSSCFRMNESGLRSRFPSLPLRPKCS